MCYTAIPGQDPTIRSVRYETPRVGTSAKAVPPQQREDSRPRPAVQSSPRMTRIPKRRW